MHLEDLDLTADDEHLNVLGKGGQRRTVLLDDSRLVGQLRAHLKQTGTATGRCSGQRRTAGVGRCGINRCRNGGRGTVLGPGCRVAPTQESLGAERTCPVSRR